MSEPLTDAERLVYAAAFTASALFLGETQPGGCVMAAHKAVLVLRQACRLEPEDETAPEWVTFLGFVGGSHAERDRAAVQAALAKIEIHDVAVQDPDRYAEAFAKLKTPVPPTYEPPVVVIQSGSFWVSRQRDGKTVRVCDASLSTQPGATITYQVKKPGLKPRSRRVYGPPVHYRRDRFLARFKRVSR